MKKIIDGKRYDTATALEVASASSSCGRGDFRSWEETLYRTPNGNWFVAGEGGPMTKYGRPDGGGMTTGGKGLFPLYPDEAREWLEEEGETKALETYFADGIEDA